MKNDLHIRTNFSASAANDWNWERVLTECEKRGLNRISITDFDTCIFHVINKLVDTSKFFKGEIITGMECDVCENGITFELLAYNFEPMKTLQWSYDVYGTLEMRQTKIKNLLLDAAKKNNIEVDVSKKFNGKVDFGHKFVYENMLGFDKNQKFFEKYGITNLTDFYNASVKNKDFPLYVDLNSVFPHPQKVIDFIHSVGGIVVLGQPLKSKNKDNIDYLLKLVLNNGVDGVEVYHPAHSKEDIKFLLDFCKKHNKIITGGSNFNGKPETSSLGIENIEDESCILKR